MLSFLHLNNNATYIPRGNPGHDPSYKLRPVFNKLTNDFLTFYIPDEELTLDEGICGFTGTARTVQSVHKREAGEIWHKTLLPV